VTQGAARRKAGAALMGIVERAAAFFPRFTLDNRFYHEYGTDGEIAFGNRTRARDSPQLAERLKTNQANVTRLERGRTQATIRTLKRIAERPATISL